MGRGAWWAIVHGVPKSWAGLSDFTLGFPGGSEVKASAGNAGDLGLIPVSGRSLGEGNGNPLQYSCLENPMDGGAWWATVHRVAKSGTRLSDFTFFHTDPLNRTLLKCHGYERQGKSKKLSQIREKTRKNYY